MQAHDWVGDWGNSSNSSICNTTHIGGGSCCPWRDSECCEEVDCPVVNNAASSQMVQVRRKRAWPIEFPFLSLTFDRDSYGRA
jgi:hypothetical protein